LAPAAIELDWEGEHRESLSDLTTDMKKEVDNMQHKEKKAMRTEKR
jgi:hypothetical protein